LAGIANARQMLAGKAAEAAAVVKSFKKSRRSVLMGKYRLSGLRLVVIAKGEPSSRSLQFCYARVVIVLFGWLIG